MRLLVFGATGFIGRHVRERATAAGLDVLTVSRRPGQGDLCLDPAGLDPATLAAAIGEAAPDAVVNCAGATGRDPATLTMGNVVAVAHLTAALAGSRTRLVHLGSAAEYGDQPWGPVTEDVAPCPAGAYGLTKLAGTELIRAAAVDGVVLRVFNPVGPGAPASSLAGRVAAGLGEGACELKLGPLTAHRDFVDVRDVADAVIAAARTAGPLPRVLNIGSGRAVPIRELVTTLVAVAGGDRRIVEEGSRDGGIGWSQADIGAATRVLGWWPTTDLATSLADLWAETRVRV